jgi:hypothetical protein
MPSNDRVEAHGLTPEDFESIRDAVMETPRGRWFLNEYAIRLRSAETSGLLDSMRRLEGAVAANHDALMARLASALAREPGAAAPAAPHPEPGLAPKHMRFFKQDEEIFEPAPAARITAVAPKPEPKPETPKGARVIIRRTEQAELSVEPLKAEAAAAAEALPATGPVAASAPAASAEAAPEPPVPAAQPAAGQAEEAPKRRIVIIRHQPGEEISVPLEDEIAKAS